MSNELNVRPATDLAAESSDQLKGRLAHLLGRSADDLREMASIVAELEHRGEDLSGLRLGIVDHLRRIAAGQLLPEVVVRFAGYPQLLRVVTALPLPDQQRLLDEGSVSLAVWREGRIEFRRADPLCLPPAQLRQVFAGDRLRNDAEQVSYLETQATPRPRRTQKRGHVKADLQRGGVRIGRAFAPIGDVMEALADLRGMAKAETAEDDQWTQTSLRLTQAELRAVKTAAAQADTSVGEILRRALWTCGMLATRHVDSDAGEQ